MGLNKRKVSGNINGGSNLIVPNQPIYSVKNIPPSFQYKKSLGKNDSSTKKP